MYLNNHTCYSLRYGILSESELLNIALHNGLKQLAITDINNTSAVLNFVRLAQKAGISPVAGVDFRKGVDQLFIGLAKNNQGFLALNQYLSKYLHSKNPIPDRAPELEDVYFIYPLSKAQEIRHFRANEYIGIRPEEVNKIRFSFLAKVLNRCVILQPVTFRNKRDFNTHRLLRAIDNNILLSQLPTTEQARMQDKMLAPAELERAFKAYPQLVQNTKQLLETCSIHFDFSASRKPQNRKSYSGCVLEDWSLLLDLCRKNIVYRYGPNPPEKVKRRVQKELTIIQQMDFVSFFLINWDIIEYAKSRDYYHVGRGSGANSIVAYLLGITDVDPLELDLYFERFMNLYRINPPDFDIDFSWRDREDITRYIFEKFGKNGQVALLATYNTFQHSAAMRELGKVFGLPKYEIDKLSDGKFKYAELDELSRLVVRYAEIIKGMPNLRSIHAGGILISEKPIHYFTATDLPPKGFPTTHFDMVIAEDVGLYKYDILGQRGLAKIKDALTIIKKNKPHAPSIDIHDVKRFLKDEQVNNTISRAACIGCFYVESPAMRMLLKKLAVDNYLGLVAASSIIRPGVAKSGMMRAYILRHKYPERRKEVHPIMWDLMKDTYGVMVYQEDVIKVAHHFAGLDLGEADVLRRGMSGKYRSRREFQKVKQKFHDNCLKKGFAPTLIRDIWNQIESFAGYAFAKGHSASYAIESYQSLFLKTYYPLEYMVAVLNNGGGFYSVETYVHEIKMLGGRVHLPCILNSHYETTIQGTDIYLGFQHIQGFEKKWAIIIVQERTKKTFQSLADCIDRTGIPIAQLEILIQIEAFRDFDTDSKKLLWEAYHQTSKSISSHQPTLFPTQHKRYKLPGFHTTQYEKMMTQIELLGFTLASPFLLIEKPVTPYLFARDLKKHENKEVQVLGYLVTIKTTRTAGGERMFFGTFLDEYGQWIDTVHFPPVAKLYPFQGKGVYLIKGRVVSEFGFLSLEVVSQQKISIKNNPLDKSTGLPTVKVV